jgi:hypothetical protein
MENALHKKIPHSAGLLFVGRFIQDYNNFVENFQISSV